MVQKNFSPVRGGERIAVAKLIGKNVKQITSAQRRIPPVVATKAGAIKQRLYVLDTNVPMHDPSCLFRFQEHDLYIPTMVFEELDNNKKGNTEAARNSREVCRTIDSLLSLFIKNKGKIEDGVPLYEASGKIASGRLFLQMEDTPGVTITDKADNQIIATVIDLVKTYKDRYEVVLVSKDINMRTKGHAKKIAVEDYHNDTVIEDSDLLYPGAVALPTFFWDKVANMTSVREGHLTCYRTSHELTRKLFVNEFAYNNSNKQAVRVVEREGTVSKLQVIIDYTIEKNSVSGIMARNREQNFALNLLMDPEVDLVTLVGPAGCGKTLMALSAAIALADINQYVEIMITRATVSVGDEIGFLPGTEEEKMSPWMGALADNIEVIAENLPFHKKGDRAPKNRGQDIVSWSPSDKITHLQSLIKVRSMAFMRGRTFLNKYVIVDEAQNLTPKQMKMLITRAGPGTKMILLGNLSQIDTPYLTEGGSGLSFAIDRFKDWEYSGHVILPKGERSRLASHANDVM